MWLSQGWKSTEQKKLIHIPFNTWHEVWIWPCGDVLDITWLYLFNEQVILKTNQQMSIAKLFSCKKYIIWNIYCGALSDPENFQIFYKKSSIFFQSLPWEYKDGNHFECNCLLSGSLQKTISIGPNHKPLDDGLVICNWLPENLQVSFSLTSAEYFSVLINNHETYANLKCSCYFLP